MSCFEFKSFCSDCQNAAGFELVNSEDFEVKL
jgi:hypothetical protein